jgi:hypothetical protein
MNWKEYKSQNVQAVDMTASVIFAHRQKFIPIRAVHLTPRMYEQFQSWVHSNLGRELELGELMEFDSVKIEKGYAGQSTPIVVELWEENFNINQVGIA